MIANPKFRSHLSKTSEWLTLDNLVAEDCIDADALLYIRIEGNFLNAELFKGDVIVVDTKRKPVDADLIFLFAGSYSTFKRFSELKKIIHKLRLVSKNGVIFPVTEDEFEIIGVVTHCLRTLV